VAEARSDLLACLNALVTETAIAVRLLLTSFVALDNAVSVAVLVIDTARLAVLTTEIVALIVCI
jgi:hypothetical protein